MTALDNIQIDLTTVEADKTVFVYYTIKGTTVRITNYSTSGAGDEGSVATESFNLNCTSVTWTYNFKDPTTKQATPSTVGFNLDTVVTYARTWIIGAVQPSASQGRRNAAAILRKGSAAAAIPSLIDPKALRV